LKAAKYIQGTKIKVAFVSTNSIVQGEQTSILWEQLFKQYNIKIHFTHRTFKWNNEAKGNAGVHVVIVGFENFDTNEKRLFEYEDIDFWYIVVYNYSDQTITRTVDCKGLGISTDKPLEGKELWSGDYHQIGKSISFDINPKDVKVFRINKK